MRKLATCIGIALFFSLAAGGFAQATPPYSPHVLGCMNTYEYRPDPFAVRLDGSSVDSPQAKFPVASIDRTSPEHRRLRERWEKDQASLQQKFEISGDFRHESDFAVALLHNGSTADALAVFQRLAAAHPKEYALASNLGTSYELSGEDGKALQWVRKAMELHPGSHEGTEWLHVRILEAKIAGLHHGDGLADHSIAGVDFGNNRAPSWPEEFENSPEEQKRIVDALRYQLKERVQFVPPRDPVVAQMLFDLSNAVALQRTLGDGMAVAAIAMNYAEGELLEKIQDRYHYYELLSDRSVVGQIRRHPWLFTSAILFIVTVLLLMLYRLVAAGRVSRLNGKGARSISVCSHSATDTFGGLA